MANSIATWVKWIAYAWRHPLAQKDRIGTYRRILRWQFRSRTSKGVIVSPWIGGASLALRRGQSGGTGNLYFGLHEYADMAFFAHVLREGEVFADIGANIGSYTVLAARVIGARVHAFEPVEQAIAALRINVAVNKIEDRVTIHSVALGRERGTARFTLDHDSMNHFSRGDEDGNTFEVPVDTLDNCLVNKGVVAMKVDVEGAEKLVFAAATNVLREPQLLAIEVETVEPEVRRVIENAGFVEYWYQPAKRELSTEPNGLAPSNHLFIRQPEIVRERVRNAKRIEFGRHAI